MTDPRDHGGGIDGAAVQYGGARGDWIDLSTGINPEPFPVGDISADAWNTLPDSAAQQRLEAAARQFWQVPDAAQVVAAPGASALIARLPALPPRGRAHVPGPTYNEHAAAFRAHGWEVWDGPDAAAERGKATARVHVHPNNPDGRLMADGAHLGADLTIIDESFCDVMPTQSQIALAARPGVIVLKSFGKFWGLAGLRLGFAIGHPESLAPAQAPSLSDMLGPWAVAGPALEIGARALADHGWAEATRARLHRDAARLDGLMAPHGAAIGGTDLFRLYDVGDAGAFQDRLARAHIWSRIFPYSDRWIRLGLPPAEGWSRLEAVL